MKFTEKSNDLEVDTLFHFTRSLAVMILFAPYRLISEISLRIVFLEKKTISNVLLGATLFGLAITAAFSGLQVYLGVFNVFIGSFPIVIMLLGDAVLGLLYSMYRIYGFVIYDKLNFTFTGKDVPADAEEFVKEDPLPVVQEAPQAAPSVLTKVSLSKSAPVQEWEQDVFSSTGTMPSAPAVLEGDTDNVPANHAVYDSQSIRDFQNRFSDLTESLQKYQCRENAAYSKEDLARVGDAMEKSTDPSKYIDEDMISMFAENLDSENLSFLEGIDLSIIPDDFTMLA